MQFIYPPDSVASSNGTQVQVYIVTQENPGYRWCQRLDGSWTTDSTIEGPRSANNHISGNIQQPEYIKVKTHANIPPPSINSSQWRVSGTDQPLSENITIDPSSIKVVEGMKNGKTYPKMQQHVENSPIDGKPRIENDRVVIDGYSGYGVPGGLYSEAGCGGRPMWNYPFPVDVMWVATATVQDTFLGLRIDPTQKQLRVGQKQHFTVYAKWLQGGQEKEYEISDDKLTWSSDAPARAPVDNGGTATGVSPTAGSSYVTITASFAEQNKSVSARVTVVDDDDDGPPDTGDPGGPGTGDPGPAVRITGDFEIKSRGIITDSIVWYESFDLEPRNINVENARYVSHSFQIERNGEYHYGSSKYSRTVSDNYTYASYPGLIHRHGAGTYNISMQIVTDKGDSGWIATKPLTITTPDNNLPPVFNAGFFEGYDYYSFDPIQEIVVNSRVNLRIIDDPRTDPPEPYDPEGDYITYTWDFAGSDSAWIRSFKTSNQYGFWEHEEQLRHIIADELGTHRIKVSGCDPWGACTERTVTLRVVPENPVPIITGPREVVEGRPLPQPFSGDESYSPVKGRTIARQIWTNKKDVYMTPGNEIIMLDVVDNTGLRSLSPAMHTLLVKPDLPPIAQLQYVDRGVRGAAMTFKDTSYSPDGDQIVEHTTKIVCDRNLNGSFADDTRTTVTLNADGSFTYTPNTVGSCAVEIFLKEDWGKTAQGIFPFTVVNLAPEVDFAAFGINPEPPNITVVAPSMRELLQGRASSLAKEEVPTNNYVLRNGGNELQTRSVEYFQPYRSISTRNADVSQTGRIYRSYCGNCGNTGTIWGYYFDFDPQNRVDRRIWGGIGTYGDDFYNEEMPYPVQGYVDTSLWHSLKDADGRYLTINRDLGLIWYRVSPNPGRSDYSHTWRDYLYRISDLKLYTPGQEKLYYYDPYVEVNAYKIDNTTVPVPGGRGTPDQVEEPAPPAEFRLPPEVIGKHQMEMKYERNPDYENPETPIHNPPKINAKSEFIADFAGNKYKNVCYVNRSYSDVMEKCHLVKVSKNGTELWRFSPPNMSMNEYLEVVYVASDSSKIIVAGQQRRTYYLLNNTSGSVMQTYETTETYSTNRELNLSRMNRLHYLGVYDDVIAYIEQRVVLSHPTSYDTATTNHEGTWRLKFRDLKTNTTRDAGAIRTYSGSVFDSCCQFNYSMVTPVPAAVISGDGKLILANYYSNVLIYDMKTYALEGDIPTGEDPESFRYYERGGEDRDRQYFIKQMYLTEDGRLKIVYRTQYDNNGGSSDNESVEETLYTIQTTPGTGPTYSYGYLPVKDHEFQNGDVSLKVTFNRNTFSDSASAGIGFRSQNHRNMYRAELSTDRVSLVKYVNGVPTVLGSYDYPIREGQTYTLRVRARGAHMTVYMDGVPVIEKSDSTYAAGQFGIYAEVPHVVLKDLQAELWEASGSNVENQAIVNMPITYTKSYTDPENDPLISAMTSWTFTNTQPYKFLDAGDGNSERPGVNTYNGVTVREHSPTLTKVGVFKVDLKETDDPAPSGYKHPNNRYADYRKESYPATRYIVVHRQPIAQFTVSVSSVDHTVIWNDSSYDPDRWLSTSRYSTEATGINYRTTRGILERKYYYKTPSGQIIYSKLVTPQELGIYTIGLAVKDEYGAWSNWTTESLNVTIVPEPDEPPKAGLTVSTISTFRGVNVTIRSTASDKEDGPAANLPHEYYIRNLDSGDPETMQSTNRGQWTKSFSTLGRMQIRQVVTDSKGQSDQAIRTVTVVNRTPTANVTTPASSNSANPTEFDELRPIFRFTYSDADGDSQERFQLRISRYDGTLVMDSGEIRSSNRQWVPTSDLPEDVNLQVRVRVHDGYEWGAYSSPKYMVIHTNKPPIANFDWEPKPVWEGDTVTIRDQSTDPDGDPLTRQWRIIAPNGNVETYGNVQVIVRKFVDPGLYRVALLVSDGRETDEIEHIIEAQPLMLEAQVNHTPNWLEVHERLEHETKTPPKDFYSGEKWLLAAASSPYPVEGVWASFSARGRDGQTISLEVRLQEDGAPDRFTGEMYEKRMSSVTEGLAPDLYEVVFRIRYANAVEKEAIVPLRIIGSVYETGGVFRRR